MMVFVALFAALPAIRQTENMTIHKLLKLLDLCKYFLSQRAIDDWNGLPAVQTLTSEIQNQNPKVSGLLMGF